jgi:hypothetical protein
MFMVLAESGHIMADSQQVKAVLKNGLDHKHYDLEYLIARTKHEATVMQVQQGLEIAQKLVAHYEDTMSDQLVLLPTL